MSGQTCSWKYHHCPSLYTKSEPYRSQHMEPSRTQEGILQAQRVPGVRKKDLADLPSSATSMTSVSISCIMTAPFRLSSTLGSLRSPWSFM